MELLKQLGEKKEKTIKRESFELQEIDQGLHPKLKRRIAEFNRLILNSMNYQAQPHEIEEAHEKILNWTRENL